MSHANGVAGAVAEQAAPWFLSLSDYADLSTTLGIVFALASVVVGFRTYDDAQASARRAHMHGLFGDYLKLRHERETSGQAQSHPPTLTTIKLYTMEELYEWIVLETKLAGRRWFRPWGPDKARMTYVSFWRRTLRDHLSTDVDVAIRHMAEHGDCYSDGFRSFAEDASGWRTPAPI